MNLGIRGLDMTKLSLTASILEYMRQPAMFGPKHIARVFNISQAEAKRQLKALVADENSPVVFGSGFNEDTGLLHGSGYYIPE